MSVLQEYELIRKELGEVRFHAIEIFLSARPDLELSDVYYKPNVFAEFEEFEKQHNAPSDHKEPRKPREKEKEEMER